ncbi:hypothetical protein FOZ61_005128 [Perkinsus olseni]|uniref:Uncharacterized protein n=1 Tax=Perkinsus olseni TaxID=32597 RepID=A0A7J6LI20_PEROL|nr:hypothetical protein FOZ61_005128 [Perkinsus olseni]
MIACRPLRLICVAFAVLLSTVSCLKSQQQQRKPDDLENGMTNPSQLEHRWAKPSEGRPDYTFVAYDPKKQDVVGEVSLSANVNVEKVRMSEEWKNRGAFTELLRQMLKNVQREKFRIKEAVHKALDNKIPDDFEELYKEAGFEIFDGDGYVEAAHDFTKSAQKVIV